MTELVTFLAAYYIVFNRRWLWDRFAGMSNEGRILFGICVYLLALLWWRSGVKP